MRISDWSSDVCSSDLPRQPSPRRALAETCGAPVAQSWATHQHRPPPSRMQSRRLSRSISGHRPEHAAPPAWAVAMPSCAASRSEEHTSELQSLMRISYAVFCLKKKTKHYTNHYNPQKNNTEIQTQKNNISQ